MKGWLKKVEHELRETLMRPGAQLTRGQRFVRYSIDLARHARRELREHSAPTMAAALTYRTIFGRVPMIVMALIVFRAFGGLDNSRQGMTDLVYDMLEIEVEVTEAIAGEEVVLDENTGKPPPAEGEAADPDELGADPDAALDPPLEGRPFFERRLIETIQATTPKDPTELSPEEQERLARLQANAEMRQRIDELVGGLAEGAATINIGSIGVFGMVLLIWAALGLIVTVEKTFNTIYSAPEGRPWHMRIVVYWSIITLGPVLLVASVYLSTQFVEATADIPVIGPVITVLNKFTALVLTWVLFLLLFLLMPNTKVAFRPAMIGAMVSALAWELMKAALRWYVDSAVISPTQSRLYGSLALIPILLFWVYVTWMVILAGLEVTRILQTLPASRVGHFEKRRPAPPTRDPWLVIPVMSALSQAFDEGKTLGVGDIAEQLEAPRPTVVKIVDELVKRGLLHRVGSDDGEGFTLALPASRIRIADLIATTPDNADASDLPGHDLLMQLAKAQDAALADITLAGKSEDSAIDDLSD